MNETSMKKAWAEFCDNLKKSGELINDPSLSVTDLDRAEGYRHLLRLLWVGMNKLQENNDPLRPYLTRYPNIPVKIGHDNPDNAYTAATIRGDQTYLVRGNMGTNIFTSFNIYSGFIGYDPYQDLRTVSSLTSREMEIAPDGSFQIMLSPEARPGNWMNLEPDATTFVVRKLFYDWENEVEGYLHIENVNPAADAPAPLDTAAAAGQLDNLARFVDSVRRFFGGAHNAIFSSGTVPANTLPPPRVGAMAMADPYNETSLGHFKLEPGQALIVEFPSTDCLYTNFQLGNMWWESLNYHSRQTHLNGHMSYLSSDGIYRYIVCPKDPGLPNWLDTEGRLEGTMFLRWTYCKKAPDSITTRVLDFDDIRNQLPQDTPEVKQEERARAIALRQAAVGRRYRA